MSDTALQRLRDWGAQTAIVLGSGLVSIVENVETSEIIAFSEFPELPAPRVAGHSGEFVLGRLGGAPVLYAKGRVHLYEGFTAREVTSTVRTLADAGVTRLILTNAAGAANPDFAPGAWMLLTDHLNLTGGSPLIGRPEFVDMSEIYSRSWRARFGSAAAELGIVLHEGIYAGLIGPQYETPAEVRMLRQMGADAIGMSTVLEAIQARTLGLEVAGFSCLTNRAAGMRDGHLSHEEVLVTGKAAAGNLARLLAKGLAAG